MLFAVELIRKGFVRHYLKPENWEWSSFRHCAKGEIGIVEIESFWTATRREALRNPRSQKRDLEHPSAPGCMTEVFEASFTMEIYT
jgi:hypothetical protein